MRNDAKSNYNVVAVLGEAGAPASGDAAIVIDHTLASAVSFIIIGAVAAVVKSQYSDDNITFTDYPDSAVDDQSHGADGNDHQVALTAAGTIMLHVPNPRARYTRVTSDAAVTVVGVQGPLRHVAA